MQSNVVKQVQQLPEKRALPLTGGLTVNGLFALVESAIARKAARLEVVYDQQLGYPLTIRIQVQPGAPLQSYRVSDFHALRL